jgi:hypothetical protein
MSVPSVWHVPDSQAARTGCGVTTWTGVVWREAGTYGPDSAFVQQMRLGRYAFPVPPEVGRTLEIDGEKYWVVSVAGRFCHVR